MAFDVFISYSSKDKSTALATCAALEGGGIRCWMAPRDVRPGMEYAAAIIEAIDGCRVMVLIFSSNANASNQIHRELERAASKGVPIVPMRIEDILPTKAMEYYLSEIHWLDALTPPLAAHLNNLTGTIRAILQADASERSQPAGAAAPPRNAFTAAAPQPFAYAAGQADRGGLWNIGARATQLGLVAFVAVGSAALVLYWQQRVAPVAPPIPEHPSPSPSPTPTAGPAPGNPKAPSAPVPAPAPTAPAPPLSIPPASPDRPPDLVIRRTAAFGGSGGARFDDADENANRLPISAIEIVENLNPADQSQRIIGSLRVRWGDSFGPQHGGKGPYAQNPKLIQFAPGEKIGRVDVNWMSYNFPAANNKPPQWVAGLAIWTDARVYQFGNMKFGPTNQCLLNHGDRLIAFFGRSGSYIDQIGCVIGKAK